VVWFLKDDTQRDVAVLSPTIWKFVLRKIKTAGCHQIMNSSEQDDCFKLVSFIYIIQFHHKGSIFICKFFENF
jgi:hypothetical protein